MQRQIEEPASQTRAVRAAETKAYGKSLADDNVNGFCKLLSDHNEKILGAHIIGKGCSEMISEIKDLNTERHFVSISIL